MSDLPEHVTLYHVLRRHGTDATLAEKVMVRVDGKYRAGIDTLSVADVESGASMFALTPEEAIARSRSRILTEAADHLEALEQLRATLPEREDTP